MEGIHKKSIRNGSIALILTFIYSFFYGAIYNEMIVSGLGITFSNIMLGITGAMIVSLVPFIVVYFMSLMI